MKIRKPYTIKKVGLDCTGDPGLTKQSMKDECDINLIIRKHHSGLVAHMRQADPVFLDCTGPEFDEAMQIVTSGRQTFEGLPSTIRNRFHNDVGEFLEFFNNEANREEAIKLGLIEKPPQPIAPVTPPTPPAPEEPAA